jgi:DegV family protein with EDD domain
VVDSGALPPTDALDGTRVIPLRIAFGDQVFIDGIDLSPEEFYARLSAGETPTTSTPSPGEYLEAYRESDAEHIVCLTIPSGLSAMNESATLAARLLADEGDERRIDVIDTGTTVAGFGLVARAAAQLCAGGADSATVLARVQRGCSEVRMFGTLRTLAYLARSGRVPSIAAGVSDLLGVRPFFEFRQGHAHRAALVRGEQKVARTFQRLAKENLPADAPLWLLVFHAAAAPTAAAVRSALHEVLNVGRSETTALSPVMGAYTGPGMTGFAAMRLSDTELGGVP